MKETHSISNRGRLKLRKSKNDHSYIVLMFCLELKFYTEVIHANVLKRGFLKFVLVVFSVYLT